MPEQLSENVRVLVSAPVDCEPLVALPLDQAANAAPDTDAVQEVASVEDQVSVEDPPLTTKVGFAARDTVGTGGAGGVPETATLAEALALPPGPIQLRE